MKTLGDTTQHVETNTSVIIPTQRNSTVHIPIKVNQSDVDNGEYHLAMTECWGDWREATYDPDFPY